jgi:hypothetical protein
MSMLSKDKHPVEAEEQKPRTQRLDVLAAQLGYTPQFVPGAGGRTRANGMVENPLYPDFAAACVLKRWSDDTQVTQADIEQAIKEVAAVTLR